MFTHIRCYVACATSVQPLCNSCKHLLSPGRRHLHTGCTSYLPRKEAADKHAEACKKFGLPPGCCVRWCLFEGPNGGYRFAVSRKCQPQKGDKKPKKGQELV